MPKVCCLCLADGGWSSGLGSAEASALGLVPRPALHQPYPAPTAPPAPAPQTMLGAWDKNSGAGTDMASPLAQTVAANKLAHSYMAFNTNYHDTGAWVLGVGA